MDLGGMNDKWNTLPAGVHANKARLMIEYAFNLDNIEIQTDWTTFCLLTTKRRGKKIISRELKRSFGISIHSHNGKVTYVDTKGKPLRADQNGDGKILVYGRGDDKSPDTESLTNKACRIHSYNRLSDYASNN